MKLVLGDTLCFMELWCGGGVGDGNKDDGVSTSWSLTG